MCATCVPARREAENSTPSRQSSAVTPRSAIVPAAGNPAKIVSVPSYPAGGASAAISVSPFQESSPFAYQSLREKVRMSAARSGRIHASCERESTCA